MADKNLSTILQAVKAAHLETELTKHGPFSILAPGVLSNLLKPENIKVLTGIMNIHMVKENSILKILPTAKAENGEWQATGSKSNERKVTINRTVIQGHDHDASNGVLHSPGSVIMTD